MTTPTRHIKNILLIDDDAAIIKFLQRVLQQKNFTVYSASNGRLGLDWLKREKVDLIITDIDMDVMDGMEIVEVVKKDFPSIKIIAYSGGSRVTNMDLLPVVKILGADRTIQKPAAPETIIEAITQLDAESAG